MSYDISNFKTIEIKDLIIPVKALTDKVDELDESWDMEIYNFENFDEISCGSGFRLCGNIIDDEIHITDIKINDDGCGRLFEFRFVPALEKSKGYLKAIITWEGGEEIEIFTVKDGEIEREDI